MVASPQNKYRTRNTAAILPFLAGACDMTYFLRMPKNIFNLLLSFGDCSGETFASALIGEASVDEVLVAEAAEGAKDGGPEEAEAMMRNQIIHNKCIIHRRKERKKTEEMGALIPW